ncbi:MAG TPA: phosphoribosylglycinamide formyltransferase [Actinobacteria bacterium]|nr:phosphoribosylglycinamide formyltransferase [Actinomycetes bacterium]HEX21563.1 phosphoribosylglycinamide formyltransferase [Actinomycetota bacterium]
MVKAKLGVLISGSGSNLQAIIDWIAAGKLDAEVAVVISNKSEAFGLTRAKKYGIPAITVEYNKFVDDDAFNQAILDNLIKYKVDWVVLAGYMRLLGKSILDSYPMRVVNLHPALLPSFPGAHAISEALAYGVRITGVTVHFADDSYDTGPIILQDFVPVHQNDTEAELRRRVQKIEHDLLPRAIRLLVEGRIKVEGRKIKVLGRQKP